MSLDQTCRYEPEALSTGRKRPKSKPTDKAAITAQRIEAVARKHGEATVRRRGGLLIVSPGAGKGTRVGTFKAGTDQAYLTDICRKALVEE